MEKRRKNAEIEKNEKKNVCVFCLLQIRVQKTPRESGCVCVCVFITVSTNEGENEKRRRRKKVAVAAAE